MSDAGNPVEVAHIVPEAPIGRDTCQINDVTVAADGTIYMTERHTGGLYRSARPMMGGTVGVRMASTQSPGGWTGG